MRTSEIETRTQNETYSCSVECIPYKSMLHAKLHPLQTKFKTENKKWDDFAQMGYREE